MRGAGNRPLSPPNLARIRSSLDLPHPFTTSSMTIDHRTEQRRQTYLDHLYAQSGRTDGLYTGLFQQRLRQLVKQDMEATLDANNPA